MKMEPWDEAIMEKEANVDFLDELSGLDDEDIVEAVVDACKLAAKDPSATEDELAQGQAAATIAAIWAGAPFTIGDILEDYPFIRELIGSGDDDLYADACEILENVDSRYDVDSFVEALGSADLSDEPDDERDDELGDDDDDPDMDIDDN